MPDHALSIPNAKTYTLDRSFLHSAIRIWNNLPETRQKPLLEKQPMTEFDHSTAVFTSIFCCVPFAESFLLFLSCGDPLISGLSEFPSIGICLCSCLFGYCSHERCIKRKRTVCGKSQELTVQDIPNCVSEKSKLYLWPSIFTEQPPSFGHIFPTMM